MTCEFCGHACAATVGSCPRCGAPIGWPLPAPPASARVAADGHTVVRTGPEPVAAPILAQPPVTGRVALAPEPAPNRLRLERGQRVAGLGTRLGGAVLDGLVLAGAELAVLFVLSVALPGTLTDRGVLGAFGAAVAVLAVAYFAVLNGRGATIGKQLVGSRVVDVRTGAPIGIWRGLLRTIVYWAECLPAGLGLLSVVNAERRAWHDRAAGSVVVWRPAPRRRQA